MEFEARKLLAMASLASQLPDKSRKGGVDAPIAPLISLINSHPSFFTTSSCSGRISILQEPRSTPPEMLPTAGTATRRKKKGGEWVYVSHDPGDADHVVRIVSEKCQHTDGPDKLLLADDLGLLVFRFEPLILAIECLNLSAAQALVSCAISSGFRESGVTSMGKRTMVAVRSSIRMEVPIAEAGRLLVPAEYVKFLVCVANEKMKANHQRTGRFMKAFIDQLEGRAAERLLHAKGAAVASGTGSLNHSKCCEGKALQDKAESCSREDPLNKGILVELENRQVHILSRIAAVDAALRKTLSAPLEAKGSCSDANYSTGDAETSRSSSANRFGECSSGDIYNMEKNVVDVVKTGVAGQNEPLYKAHISAALGGLKLNQRSGHDAIQNSMQQNAQGQGRFNLIATNLSVFGEPVEKLYRWGHSTCVMPALSGTYSSIMLVFGGYGGPARHCRQNDLLIFDCESKTLQSMNVDKPPITRMGHTASTVREKMIVIGGREDPSKSLGDVCIFNVETMQWTFPRIGGSQFPPRHRHAAVTVGDNIYVFGGLHSMGVLGDFYVLDTQIMQWSQLKSSGETPSPRHSHSLAAIGDKIYLFGGRDEKIIYGDLHVWDLRKGSWSNLKMFGEVPVPKFSHYMVAFGRFLLVVGGCPVTKQANDFFLLDTDTMKWRYLTTTLLSHHLLVRHTANLVGDQLFLLGGGASCFAFGTKFSPPLLVNIACLLSQDETKFFEGAGVLSDNGGSTECGDDQVWALKIHKTLGKCLKDTLKQAGWLDLTRKSRVSDDGSHVIFPVSKEAVFWLQRMEGNSTSRSNIRGPEMPAVIDDGESTLPRSSITFKALMSLKGYELIQMESCGNDRLKKSPQSKMREAVSSLLYQNGLPTSLLFELPKRWERLDDMAVMPANSFSSSTWQSLGQQLWVAVAKCLGVRRLACQAPIAATGTRDSNLHLLLGDNGWVQHQENGILYCFDATKCMFSSGNVSEKLRLASLDCRDEVVVDLFAGIGYFVLPFLLKAGAKKVYACEWNSHALAALRHNLCINKVEDRCIVLEGDNRITAPQGIANRVCLGLLPTSEGSWATAVKALRPEGGILHLHGNVKDTGVHQWIDYVCTSIKDLSADQGYCWNVVIDHVERVKWYAPHIRHLVADVKCEAVPHV